MTTQALRFCHVLLLATLGAAACAALLVVAGPALADDVTPPAVLAFSMAPAHVNTESGAQTVTVTATASDGQTGVREVTWQLSLPGSSQPCRIASLSRISGDLFTGTWSGQLTLPKGSQGGTWLARLNATDVVGNAVFLTPEDLTQRFGAGAAQIVNDAIDFDAAAPRVTALTLTPATVNTETADQVVTVSASLSDDFAGIVDAQLFLHPLAATHPSFGCGLQRVSGDELSGAYQGTITLPAGSRGGEWVASLSLQDGAENTVMLYPGDLESLLGASSMRVTNEATVFDATPPRVVAYSVTPSEVDASAGARTLAVSITVADDGSGVAGLSGILQPLIGMQEAPFSLQRVSGDDHLCTYEGTALILQGAKEGVWTPTLSVEDSIGNWAFVRSPELAAAVPGAPGLFVTNTATARQVTIDRAWTLRAESVAVSFPEGTVVTRTDEGEFAFYRMTATPFAIEDDLPAAGLGAQPVATLRFGIPDLNLSFSQPVRVVMTVGSRYNGYRLAVRSLVEGGSTWTKESTVEVAGGRISFEVDHATRFAASLTAPRLTRLRPATLRRGARLTIAGEGFGARRGKVKFGARTCTKYLSWSPTRITCKVPARAKLGRLRVKVVTAGGASNPMRLRVRR